MFISSFENSFGSDDPLEPNRHCVKAVTGKLKDPVKIDQQKAESESSMLKGRAFKPKTKLGKETLDVQLWASGQIEATPYGTFAKMMSSKKNGDDAMTQKRNETMKSHIIFDHYQYPSGKDAIDKEMPRGKRIHPTAIFSDPGRVFGHLPPSVEKEISQIQIPENFSWSA